MAVVGIDLGTTYSAVARCVNGIPEIIPVDGEVTVPSVVSVLPAGKIVVGKAAKNNQARSPENTIVEVKRKMGTTDTVKLGGKDHTAPEISAMILRMIKEKAEEMLGEKITGAVITCPAYFKNEAKEATKTAGELADLKVLKIINEPTAAAYAYGVMQGNDDSKKLFVVYDLGGGTFDVTVILMTAGQLEVIGTGGDPNLGGGDFDDHIVEWMLGILGTTHPGYLPSLSEEKRRALKLKLKTYAEAGKKQLCVAQGDTPSYKFSIPTVDTFQDRPVPFTETLTMPQFEGLIRQRMENSMNWVDEALKVPREKHQYSDKDITAILLVGGSTRVPMVRRILEQKFPSTPVWGEERGINPDEIVALGASIAAADEDPDSDKVPDTNLVDVTGHTLSVECHSMDRNLDYLVPIIHKETPIPCAGSHKFHSNGNYQAACRIKVYQGEGVELDPSKVTKIGEFEMKIAPIKEGTPIVIGLNLDRNGLLVAHAMDELSGARITCDFDYKDSARMTPQQVVARKAELAKQMEVGFGAAAAAATAAMAGTAPPAAASAPAATTAPPTGDPTAMMSSMAKDAYQKAREALLKVPPEKAMQLLQVSSEMEAAARSGNHDAMNRCTIQLLQLLQGV